MNLKRIYKRSMAEYLIDHGCPLIKVTQDITDEKRKNWLFEDTLILKEKMSEFTSLLNR